MTRAAAPAGTVTGGSGPLFNDVNRDRKIASGSSMQPAEVRAIKDLLGCSAKALAAQLGVSWRQVMWWLGGGQPVPARHVNALTGLLADRSTLVQRIIGKVLRYEGFTGDRTAVIPLLRYADADAADCPYAPHWLYNSAVAEAYAQLLTQNYRVALVQYDPEAYRAWLGRRDDKQARREEWAVNAHRAAVML